MSDDEELEQQLARLPNVTTRKVYIKGQAGSAHITLPKDWVKANGLEHKSTIVFKVVGRALIIMPSGGSK